MFQHAVLRVEVGSWFDMSGTSPLAYWRRSWSQEAAAECLALPGLEQCIGRSFPQHLHFLAVTQYIHCPQEAPYLVSENPIHLSRKVSDSVLFKMWQYTLQCIHGHDIIKILL